MTRQTILLLFGGESSEHDVSILSARNVYTAIDKMKYEVALGFIDKAGKWWLADGFGETDHSHQLVPQFGLGNFLVLPGEAALRPDVILPVLHGKNGEDGAVAALGQLLHVPVVGCDMTAGALCMDKRLTKLVLQANDIQVVPFATHRVDEAAPEFATLIKTLGSPLFIKPARAGSSVGVSKVANANQLSDALDKAHRHDDVVLIEQAVTARELEVAVLGNPPRHTASGVGEVIPGDEFYSYDDKYASDSRSIVKIPADLDDATREKIRACASRAYDVLGCADLARIDFFLASDGTLYLNEVNTLPGFTNISMYPKLWNEAGMSYPQLIDALISSAKDRTVTTE